MGRTPAGVRGAAAVHVRALSPEQLQGEELTSTLPGRSGQLHDAAAGKKLRWTLPAFLPSAPSFGAHL